MQSVPQFESDKYLVVFEGVGISVYIKYEPRHDKTNEVTLRPAKTQIGLSIRPV